jgi:hypothetical protein
VQQRPGRKCIADGIKVRQDSKRKFGYVTFGATMNRTEYLKAVNEFIYQGEVLGEAVFAAYLERERDAERVYKWGTLLQLETETKARLRPFMTRVGLSIAQDDVRDRIAEFAASFASKSWRQHMEELAAITNFFLEKFREIESAAPESEREVARSMVVHESAINRFTQLELAGDAANSLNDVIAQLRYPLVNPA